MGTFNGETGPSYIPLVEGEVVEIVLQNTLALNGVAEMHTWHLHGHSFWVVGSGVGIFDENTDPDSYNLLNPVRRDTATVLPYGWTALRVRTIFIQYDVCHDLTNRHLNCKHNFYCPVPSIQPWRVVLPLCPTSTRSHGNGSHLRHLSREMHTTSSNGPQLP